jgi:genome maintenance exonuclease 1
LVNDERHYELGSEKLPSVTTILAATQSDEKRASLDKWKARVGSTEADKIKNTAASRGTNMHSHLEYHLNGQGLLDLSNEGQVARNMADKIIEEGFGDLSEIWGSEVVLHYPGLYAGATDLAGIYQ